MVCYNCGCHLSEHNFCTACRVDVGMYKKIMALSNRFYNEGLEKAGIRDLTGAISSLKQSLKFNKNNIEARNLLGLVYYELGEVISALREWVISKNLMLEKNIADGYIKMIQSNQSKLDTINQTIKKYNQALNYCRQGNLDIAVIQLKKVLSLNSRFVRAHQLLALLYMDGNEWEKARRELNKCIKIDAKNTSTLRYLKEVEGMLTTEEGVRLQPRKKELVAKEAVTYQSGNELIIQPIGAKEPRGVPTLFNMGIGIVVGLAVAWFLVLPARLQSTQAAIDTQLRTISEQSDAKTATITGMEQQIQDLEEEKRSLQEKLNSYVGKDGTLQAMDKLLSAANTFLAQQGDVIAVSEFLDGINIQEMGASASPAFITLYQTLTQRVGPELATTYYDKGYSAYKQENYQEAVVYLEKAYQYDTANGDVLFYLANSYRATNSIEQAKEAYVKVINEFPDTIKANKSQVYLAEINNGN